MSKSNFPITEPIIKPSNSIKRMIEKKSPKFEVKANQNYTPYWGNKTWQGDECPWIVIGHLPYSMDESIVAYFFNKEQAQIFVDVMNVRLRMGIEK